MKRYNSDELDTKIDSFLNKKFEKYPELASPRQEDIVSKHSFAARIVHSFTSRTMLSSN